MFIFHCGWLILGWFHLDVSERIKVIIYENYEFAYISHISSKPKEGLNEELKEYFILPQYHLHSP